MPIIFNKHGKFRYRPNGLVLTKTRAWPGIKNKKGGWISKPDEVHLWQIPYPSAQYTRAIREMHAVGRRRRRYLSL